MSLYYERKYSSQIVEIMTSIGLDQAKSNNLVKRLNEFLVNYQVFYMNVRSFHWNIKGQKFFELHLKFEELYNDLLIKVDEIAERVLTLGGTPLHAYSDYLLVAEIKAEKGKSSAEETVDSLLNSFKVVIKNQRAMLFLSEDAEDEGTNVLMSDYI